MEKELYDSKTIKHQFGTSNKNQTQIAAARGLSVPSVYKVLNGEDVRVSTLFKVLEELDLCLRIEKKCA